MMMTCIFNLQSKTNNNTHQKNLVLRYQPPPPLGLRVYNAWRTDLGHHKNVSKGGFTLKYNDDHHHFPIGLEP